MSYTVTLEGLDNLASSWVELKHLRWSYIFILPQWLKVWWSEFGSGSDLYLCRVRQGDTTIGIAPLRFKDNVASFIGSADVCDYLDFVVAPGKEQDFFNALLDNLVQKGINLLDLKCLRPDSTTFVNLIPIGQARGYKVSYKNEDVSVEFDLPATWEAYLEMLEGKQRHEVRRKLKKLSEVGDINYHIADGVESNLDIFLQQFRDSRTDKANFMTAKMESFFRSMSKVMVESGLLRLGTLNFNALPVASLMYFDYQDKVYLYNSSYDPKYDSLSVGLLSKVLCIKDSIERNKKNFDFLKGNEAYKYRLGGKEIPIYNCQIVLK